MGKHLICACSVSLLLWWQHAKTGNMMTWTWLTETRKQRRLNTNHYLGKVSRNIWKSLANVSVWRSLTSCQDREHILWEDRVTCRLLPWLRLRVRWPRGARPSCQFITFDWLINQFAQRRRLCWRHTLSIHQTLHLRLQHVWTQRENKSGNLWI